MASPVTRAQVLTHGTEYLSGGGVRFRLWAPAHEQIGLVLLNESTPRPMRAVADGWHELTVAEAQAGTLYRFALPDGTQVPDPAARFQPQDVHGPSEVINPRSYMWQDGAWTGRPWHEAVIYELHVGTFTEQGTFAAVRDRIDHLVQLGITAIEIMPIADFPGTRNWGYDGVLPYAPDASYGRPDDLKALIDEAHQRGLMVLLDVVYNHFGPDGNFLGSYAPPLFTDRHKTPWGAAINYDGTQSQPVRSFMIDNALYWLVEYNLDGLRLDAVHAIIDDSPTHLLDDLADRVRATIDRPVHLILENEENQASRLQRRGNGAPCTYTAQWNDDVHHVLHVAATGENHGYYVEYLGDTEKLARALAEGFAFQGQMMQYRGKPRGEMSAALPPQAFIAFIQNHDQVGNRAFGERISEIAPEAAVRAIAAVYLLLPQVPMLFMGEEWAAAQPFPFFCDFDGTLAEAVRQGRREEFARFPEFRDAAMRAKIPDPQSPATFLSAKLAWDDIRQSKHAERLAWYRQVLATRAREIVPLIPQIGSSAGQYNVLAPGAVVVTWKITAPSGHAGASALMLEANLSAAPAQSIHDAIGHVIWNEGAATPKGLAPWSVRWSLVTPNAAE